MSSKENNVILNSKYDASAEKTIILNVGGVKYETQRSTLLSYPDTFLGTMFAKRNLSLLHPKNENEYFIDRDGSLFRYVIQYYRTGKVYLPKDNVTSLVSLKEIEAELDYFQIPFKKHEKQKIIQKLSFTNNPTVEKLDQFIYVLRNVIKEVMGTFETEVMITFSKNGYPPFMNFGRYYVKNSVIMEHIDSLIKPFGSVAYTFLDKYGSDIGQHLKGEIPELSWQYGYSQNREQLKLHMSISNIMSDEEIFKHSRLNLSNMKIKEK
ncbi:12874_t:CDS:2 [Funneliformis mosseae]|uniref:12874_t:CDS:1 n=1 Tax=Funneliformis mosseae TaxID=27381 RepID=A0A9N9FC93_FUNMO|nr:12874_t:CDS:2 [Funneliformis mosseae]